MDGASSSTWMTLKPGEKVSHAIGGTGRPVVGQLMWPEGTNMLTHPLELDRDGVRKDWEISRLEVVREDGQTETFDLNLQNYARFRFEDVPAGEAVLRVTATGLLIEKEFTIPTKPGGRSDQSLDLGQLHFQPKP